MLQTNTIRSVIFRAFYNYMYLLHRRLNWFELVTFAIVILAASSLNQNCLNNVIYPLGELFSECSKTGTTEIWK